MNPVFSHNSKGLNVNTNHPIIPNSQNYTIYKKYVSIHSEDRDMNKYPNSSQFEIELPEDYLNVSTIRLSNWTFPANYDTFSQGLSNTTMTFAINIPYDPSDYGVTDALQVAIFTAINEYNNGDNPNYMITIDNGFYNPDQMTTELTNRFNAAVNMVVQEYLLSNGYTTLLSQFITAGGYSEFVIVYNTVKQNIWFGNKSSGFILTNEITLASSKLSSNLLCSNPQLPDFSNWGLPGFLGLDRKNDYSVSIPNFIPRFYYGDVFPGDNGYWLIQDLSGAQVYFFESPYKINLMGPSHMYMEIEGLNCIDETSPFAVNKFTSTTNITNGVVNSSFAKIPIPATPMSQWFDSDDVAVYYKLYLPPAERIRRLKIKIRYHNGSTVNFGVFNYNFTLEFALYSSQQLREYNLFQPSLGGIAAR
jgi:hypothetical protein